MMKKGISRGDYGAHFPRETPIKLPEIASTKDKRREKKCLRDGQGLEGRQRKTEAMSHTG